MRYVKSAAMAAGLAAACGAAMAQNLLENPGAETRCSGPAAGWTAFGPSNERSFFARTGVTAIKQFGSWCGDPCYGTGIFQDRPAVAGQQFQASAWITNPCWDAFSPGAQGGIVTIDFLDAAGNFLTPFPPVAPNRSGRVESPTLVPGETCAGSGAVEPNFLQTGIATAPAGTATVRIYLRMEQFRFGGGAGWWDDATLEDVTNPGVNLLDNPSFEAAQAGCGGSLAAFWTNFGNGQHNFGEIPRSGDYALRLFGGFNGNPAFSGWWQQVPAVEGEQFVFSGWGRTADIDRLQNGNNVRLGVEFFDEFGTNLVGLQAPSDPMPTGDDAILEYAFFSSGVAVAPPGTAFARALILQEQFDFSRGSTWWDDLEFVRVTAGCPCVADFDGSGGTPDGSDIEAYFAAWLAGDASTDSDCSGGTPDGTDIEIFFGQWLVGGC